MRIKCIVVDDHTLFRDGIRRLLESEADITVVDEASDAADAVQKTRELRPNVVLMDIGMPGMSSFEAARMIRKDLPDTKVIFLTMYEDEEYLVQSLDAGASGYILKDAPPSQLISAVREVHGGRRYIGEMAGRGRPGSIGSGDLTPREREVVKLIAEGNSVAETARLLHLSTKTVEVHKFNLMRKLGIHNTAQLVTYAIQRKIVKVPLRA